MKEFYYELRRNKGNTRGLVFVFFFRISSICASSYLLRIVGFPIRLFYRIVIRNVFGVQIYDSTKIGYGLKVFHGMGLVVNPKAMIGNCCTLRQNTTIGNSHSGGDCPVIGNNVNIGANTVILGSIRVGDNSIIGAGSVVVKDVPENTVVVGNPARVISRINEGGV